MAFKTDAGGFAFKCGDVKLQGGSSTWASRLSQLGKMKGCVRILTYSLPDLESIRGVLSKRPENILIIANPKAANVESRAEAIKEEFPNIRIALNEETHSKVLSIAPDSLMVSSANFGLSGWHETTVSFHQKEAHDHYVENVFEPLWNISEEVADTVRLESLPLSGPETTDEKLAFWALMASREPTNAKLSSVSTIRLDSSKITDAGLQHLKVFGKLEHLDLSNTKITDTGLVHLQGLTNLKLLDLCFTHVTDAGLVPLKGLTKLRTLSLWNTKVTDAGLEHLKGLTNLKGLGLRNTHVNVDGIQELQEALPNCSIYGFKHNAEALSV